MHIKDLKDLISKFLLTILQILKISYVDFEFEEKPEYNITAKIFLNENNLKLDDFNFVYFKNVNLI
ncbi:hypothetical protein DBB36_16285, partial [Flavobacterium sp. WLB]|uniref:hypothetical protein n=2 Tax=Flavobacterium TaxID=237 RepID=UPI000DE66B23